MYNRYIRNDNGQYNRVVQHDDRTQQELHAASPPAANPSTASASSGNHSKIPPQYPPSSRTPRPSELHFLDKLLSRFHLSDIDSGDLILLLLLFFLFHEDGDEELMIALGLLLIL